jgi:hypothetical protein
MTGSTVKKLWSNAGREVRFAPQHPEEQSSLVAALGKHASALRKCEAEYIGNPIWQNLFRAGHASTGVIVIPSLVCQVLMDLIVLPRPFAWIVRIGIPAAAILNPAGFFLSVGPPHSERSNCATPDCSGNWIVVTRHTLVLQPGLSRLFSFWDWLGRQWRSIWFRSEVPLVRGLQIVRRTL